MPIEIVTKQDLQENLQKLEIRILEAFKRFSKANNTEIEWLRTKEACKLLQCSPGKLQSLRSKGILSPTRMGGSIYYDRKDIAKVMEKNKTNND